MVFQQRHRVLANVSNDFVLEGLRRPEVCDLAEKLIVQSGRQNKRICPLKPRLVLWLIVALSLYRNDSIVNVFERLMAWVKEREPRLCRGMVTGEAICHARERLGALPLKLFYRETVKRWKPVKSIFYGFRVLGIDGSEFTVPDTKANVRVFGRHKNDRAPAAYPQLRGVFLVDVAARRIADCSFLPCSSSETAALRFLTKNLGPGDLLALDRGLSSFGMALRCQEKGIKILFRISSVWKPEFIRKLGKGDSLMKFRACSSARRKLPENDKDRVLVLRVLEFRVGKGEIVRLVTNLTDEWKYPASELAQLYHERWECEIAFKELKSQLVAVTASKQQTHFRSKSPIKVLQEAWGMVLAHTFVRELMLESAVQAEMSPLELSFTDSLQTIKLALSRFQAAGPRHQKKLYKALISDIGECRIDRPRRKRQCPRVVKRKMSSFPKKREGDHAKPLDTDIEFVP